MEWQLTLMIVAVVLLFLMMTGMPVAMCFMLIVMVGSVYYYGMVGLDLLIKNIYSTLASFVVVPLALFILMGEVLFCSGIGPRFMATLDLWLGRVPGRLGLLAVAGGCVFSVLTGVSVASVAMLGDTLIPEMEKRGYKRSMSLGPILGSGGLAIMIPPSGLAILLGALGEISIGAILMAIIFPGVFMALFYAGYILIRCTLQPSIAPAYEVPHTTSLGEKVLQSIYHLLPVGVIIFLVTGVIIIGVATPTEAAATGAIGMYMVVAAYGRLNWELLKKSIRNTIGIMVMIMFIIAAAKAFGSILSFSGAADGLAVFAVGLPVHPIVVVSMMIVMIILMGCLMDPVSIMMITLPIFVPAVIALGVNPILFSAMYLLAMEMGQTSPPFGLALFVMKGVAPSDVTMREIYLAALPFLVCDLMVIILMMAFPQIALWLPGILK